MVERKFADRSGWLRIIEKEFKTAYFNEDDFKGWVTTLKLKKVANPLMKRMGEKEICIVDNEYIWLQHYPENKNYCITTMYNNNLEIVQWYFDITKNIGINEDGIPFFDDLYLDIVLLPNSEVFVLDKDELEHALINNVITDEEYKLANNEAENILKTMIINKEKLHEFCNKYLRKLHNS